MERGEEDGESVGERFVDEDGGWAWDDAAG